MLPNFQIKDQTVTVCGYFAEEEKYFYQNYHSNPLILRDTRGLYNIDTKGGQSGSPVHFMTDKNVCHVVGLHKGYDPLEKLNVCTMIN